MSRPTKPGVRIRMKFDFVFDTEDPKATLPHVDINTFIAAGLRAVGYKRGCVEPGAGFKATIVTRKKGSTDNKHVEIWTYQGRRIDVFFLT